MPDMQTRCLSEQDWKRQAEDHRQRATHWTNPARRRHASGVPHPIEDFLFSYYSYSFGKLENWHPPIGVSLEVSDCMPFRFTGRMYRQTEGRVFADPDLLSTKARARFTWIRELLERTSNRRPVFSCHGLHEWAMVYRGKEVRHRDSTPLRLPQDEIDSLVESRPMACTHFDAFRFFHPDAQERNLVRPTLEGRPDFEQPGCVHANMDLYKWASKTMPWVGSALLIDCFELAVRLRDLDMRASPYDLAQYGLTPVRIEEPAGRQEYERIQAQLATEARVLRLKLIECLDLVLS